MLGKDKPQEYFRDFSISIKQSGVKCPILLTGGIRSIKSMEEIVSQGVSDMIGLGRPMILDPELPKKLLYRLGYTKAMIDKCPTLFDKNGLKKFEEYLALNGVRKIKLITESRKHYLSFKSL